MIIPLIRTYSIELRKRFTKGVKRCVPVLGIAGVILAVSIAFVFAPSRLRAQAVNNAQIHGAVQDATGAVVPNAQIKATQADTGRTQIATSGADGSYVLPDMNEAAAAADASACI